MITTTEPLRNPQKIKRREPLILIADQSCLYLWSESHLVISDVTNDAHDAIL